MGSSRSALPIDSTRVLYLSRCMHCLCRCGLAFMSVSMVDPSHVDCQHPSHRAERILDSQVVIT
ncbi:hypothetical protein CsatB_015883 [Cannabis sativa]